jgi:hypothetical protein
MTRPDDQLRVAADVVGALRRLGFDPVLVGGMALVVLGSRRVTQDFDFLIADPADRVAPVLDVFYDRGFELVSTLDAAGDVVTTIGNRKVAAARFQLDQPASAYFFNRAITLRIDLLFDFPVPAASIAARATRMKISGHAFVIASEPDLLELKRMARAARSVAGDAQDIEFLESRLPRSGSASTSKKPRGRR